MPTTGTPPANAPTPDDLRMDVHPFSSDVSERHYDADTGEWDGQIPTPAIAAVAPEDPGRQVPWPDPIHRDGHVTFLAENHPELRGNTFGIAVLRRMFSLASDGGGRACYESQANIARYVSGSKGNRRRVNEVIKWAVQEAIFEIVPHSAIPDGNKSRHTKAYRPTFRRPAKVVEVMAEAVIADAEAIIQTPPAKDLPAKKGKAPSRKSPKKVCAACGKETSPSTLGISVTGEKSQVCGPCYLDEAEAIGLNKEQIESYRRRQVAVPQDILDAARRDRLESPVNDAEPDPQRQEIFDLVGVASPFTPSSPSSAALDAQVDPEGAG